MEAVTIPVMAKVRIGHFVEAQVGNILIISSYLPITNGVIDSTVDRSGLHR